MLPALGLVLIAGVLLTAGLYARRSAHRADEARAAWRRRFTIPETSERLPIAEPRTPSDEPAHPIDPGAEPPAFEPTNETSLRGVALDAPFDPVFDVWAARDASGVRGRIVDTPDGQLFLSEPPFLPKERLLDRAEAWIAREVKRRLPPGCVLCPKVRLESLVVPRSPEGRDVDDWRTWRRRVRMRCVDLLIVEKRSWRPVVAVEVDPPTDLRRTTAGRPDRMIDEVLGAIGLPLVRVTPGVSTFDSAWELIEPHLARSPEPA